MFQRYEDRIKPENRIAEMNKHKVGGYFTEKEIEAFKNNEIIDSLPKIKIGKRWWSRLLFFPFVYSVVLSISIGSTLLVIITFPFSFLKNGVEI